MSMVDEADVTVSTTDQVTVRVNRGVGWFAKHWLMVFNAFWGLFVILPWLAPIFMQLGWTRAGRILYFVYNFFYG